MNCPLCRRALLMIAMLMSALGAGMSTASAAPVTDEKLMQYLLGSWNEPNVGRWEFTAELLSAEFPLIRKCYLTIADGTRHETKCQYVNNLLRRMLPMGRKNYRSGGEIRIIDENHFTEGSRKEKWTRVGSSSSSAKQAASQARADHARSPQGAWEAAQAKLKAAGKPLTLDNMAPLLPAAILTRVQQEVDVVSRDHKEVHYLKLTYDGECKKQEYLKERMAWPTWDGGSGHSSLEQQPREVYPVRDIETLIGARCFVKKGAAQNGFETCMNRYVDEPSRQANKRFCSCTADKYATALERAHQRAIASGAGGVVDNEYSGYMSDAYVACHPYRKS